MKFFDKFKKKQEVVIDTPKKEIVLYLLLETPKGGIVNYLQGNGVLVKSVETDIDTALKKIIRETNDLRLLVVDYGLGIFTEKSTRSDLIELIETSSSDGKSVTVFTNNGAIIKDLKNREINAQTANYKGASDIVKELSTYHEIYTTGGAVDLEIENQIDFKGEKIEITPGPKLKPVDLHIVSDDEQSNGIQSFNVKY